MTSMRVLHVIASTQRRGAEVFASDLVHALSSIGLEQRVAVLHGNGDGSVDFDAPVTFLEARPSTSPGRSLPGVKVVPRVVGGIRDLIVRWRPDVVQAHGGGPLKHVILAAKRSDTPVLYRRIGSAPSGIRRGPRRLAHSFLMRRATMIVAVAEALRREAIERFAVPPSRIVVIPNGIDGSRIAATKDRAEVRASLGLGREQPVLLSLGAISWEKDPLAHLAVAQRVTAHRADVRHLIVGGGPMVEEVRREIRRRSLDRWVSMLGTRSDIGNLLAAADVLLFASRSDGMEGMPAQVIEAGMSGLPVAGYSIAGVPEVVRDGDSGALVKPGDVAGLAAAVVRMLGDAELRRSMGIRAREHCTIFDITAVAPRYARLYEAVGAGATMVPGRRGS